MGMSACAMAWGLGGSETCSFDRSIACADCKPDTSTDERSIACADRSRLPSRRGRPGPGAGRARGPGGGCRGERRSHDGGFAARR